VAIGTLQQQSGLVNSKKKNTYSGSPTDCRNVHAAEAA
jgi:hypothetical protein